MFPLDRVELLVYLLDQPVYLQLLLSFVHLLFLLGQLQLKLHLLLVLSLLLERVCVGEFLLFFLLVTFLKVTRVGQI